MKKLKRFMAAMVIGVILQGSGSTFLAAYVRAEEATSNQTAVIVQDGVEFSICNAAYDHDDYAVIDNYSNAKNVTDGVFVLPTEVVYNRKTYPVIGANGFCDTDNIREVVVPKEFGNQQVKIPEVTMQQQLGGNNFFVLPNIEKITIQAENIRLCNVYVDGGDYVEQQGRSKSESKIKEISITSKEVSIAKNAITDLEHLQTLSLSQAGKVTLDKYAIVNCGTLKELSLPKNTKFTEGAISLCTSLKKVRFAEGAKYTGTKEVISPVGTLLFVPANEMEYTVPNTVKKVGDLAFSNCSKLKKVSCGAEIIGEYAFLNCEIMKTLKLTNTKKIESHAFTHTGISSITIPKSVKSIGHGILYQNKSLKTIRVSGKYYKSMNGALTTASGKTLLAVIPKSGLVNIPKGVMTTRALPVTAPDKVKEMRFPSTLRNIYQMGKTMKQLVKITFTSTKVPKGLEKEVPFSDDIFSNMGYDREVIWANASGKLVIDVPDKVKKEYKKFIHQEIACGVHKYTLK